MYGKIHRQKGMTGVGWLLLLSLLGILVFMGIKIVPMYLENYAVKASLKGLAESETIATDSAAEVYNSLSHRLDVNGIDSIGREQIEVNKSPGALRVTVTYEVQRPLIANLDVVGYFEEVLELEFR